MSTLGDFLEGQQISHEEGHLGALVTDILHLQGKME
jgi:hypothetical protein